MGPVRNIPFQMEYVSFTRTRLTNKMMYDYVDRNRGRLTVNIFHNYSIDFHLHPERPHLTFSPPKIKVTCDLLPFNPVTADGC